jgi:hypothetical protein
MRVLIEFESVMKSEHFKIKEKCFCSTGSYFLFPGTQRKPSVLRNCLMFLQIVQSGSFPTISGSVWTTGSKGQNTDKDALAHLHRKRESGSCSGQIECGSMCGWQVARYPQLETLAGKQCCGSVTFWFGSGFAPLTNGSGSGFLTVFA